MTLGPLKNIVNNRFFITLGVQRTHLGGTWEPKGPQGGPGEAQGSPGGVHRSQKEIHGVQEEVQRAKKRSTGAKKTSAGAKKMSRRSPESDQEGSTRPSGEVQTGSRDTVRARWREGRRQVDIASGNGTYKEKTKINNI